MKRYIYLLLSLVTVLFFPACTNDDIKIDKLLPKHTVTYNVSTQNMYDTFGQTSYVRENFLREDTLCIGITTFVYDSNGNLVDSKLTTIKNFNSTPQTFDDLLEGQYTFVTIETMLNPINSYRSSCWSFDDTESLNTLKITQTRMPSRVNILGICYETVSVANNVSINVTPEAIGSFINFHCYNWEKSKYLNLGFATQDRLKYYSLDPKLSRKDRFNRDLTASDHFNIRGTIPTESASQGKFLPIYILESDIDWSNAGQDESKINTTSWTPWKTHSATLEDGKIYEAGFYFLYSENDSNYADSYLGDMEGFDSWKQEWDDFIKSMSSKILFKEPYLTWGGSVASVKSFMSDYQLGYSGNTEFGYALAYYGKYKETEIDYYFTTQTNDLIAAVVYFDTAKVGEDELAKAFAELGYDYQGPLDDDSSLYQTKDRKTRVEFGINNNNEWYIQYTKVESASRNKTPNLKKKKEFLKESTKNIHNNTKISKKNLIESLRECESTMKLNSLK